MEIDLKELRKRKEFIKETISGSSNLIIWNYNAKCQYERAWDQYTMMTRGLITDWEGNVIARPFPKFFNLGESEATMFKNLPKEWPIITDKLDGSLGILYEEYGEINIATRGSFDSKQAIWATKWIQDRYVKGSFLEGYTYLFEIIYPDNRIVVDYKEKKELMLLAVIENKTGKELHHIEQAQKLKINYCKIYGGSVRQVIESLPKLDCNQEGYVAKYSNGLRVKFKGDEYKKIHKLITQCSTISIWEILMTGSGVDELINLMPGEFTLWIKKEAQKLQNKYNDIYYYTLSALEDVSNLDNRKDQAMRLKEYHKKYLSLVFSMMDGKFKEEMIWKMIKPVFKIFSEDHQ